MSLIDNIDKVALVSTYPTDKIVDVISGSFNAGSATSVAGYLKLHSARHNQTRPVFTRLKWSTDNVTWIDGGFSYREGDTSFLPTIAYSDSTSVYVLTGVTSGTVYYEIICFWIDDYDATDPLVETFFDATKPLAFDSRLNYQKIYKQGLVSFTSTSDQTVTYDLDTISSAWVYYEAFPGQVWPAVAGGVNNYFLYDVAMAELQVTQTPSSVTLSGVKGPNNFTAWYNIYTP